MALINRLQPSRVVSSKTIQCVQTVFQKYSWECGFNTSPQMLCNVTTNRFISTLRSNTLKCVHQEFSIRNVNVERHKLLSRLWSYTPVVFLATKTSKVPLADKSALLKNLSALQVKRASRKKIPKISDGGYTIQIKNVVAYAAAEEINLHHLMAHLVKQGLYNIENLPQDVTSALHIRGKYNVAMKPKDIFVFEDGSVVFWCVPETERAAFMRMLTRFSEGPYKTSLVIFEREEMDFTHTEGATRLSGDIIELCESPQLPLEMYTFSNAMAQSVKLAIWEASLDTVVNSIETVTEDLRHGRKISMSRREVLMKTGELFSLRHLINLSSDLLDTPDFYWDRAGLEPLYLALCAHLNITRRTRVVFEFVHYLERYLDKPNEISVIVPSVAASDGTVSTQKVSSKSDSS